MQKEPPPFVWAAPDEKDILTCAPIFRRDGLNIYLLFFREFYYRADAHLATDVCVADSLPPFQHGPPDSPYVGGEYHGVLLFPSEYPFKPPGIKVSCIVLALTPRLYQAPVDVHAVWSFST